MPKHDENLHYSNHMTRKILIRRIYAGLKCTQEVAQTYHTVMQLRQDGCNHIPAMDGNQDTIY